jgi:DNA topoisomerase-2
MTYYDKRKAFLVGMLQAEAGKLSNQARFICEKCDGDLVVENKRRAAMIRELAQRGYDSDPVAAWRKLYDKQAGFFFVSLFDSISNHVECTAKPLQIIKFRSINQVFR